MSKAKHPIIWDRSCGWRAGERYAPPGTSAVDVVRYEQEELKNELDVPDFLLHELEQARLGADQIVWVCRTRDHARRYGRPYREPFGQHAIVVATDGEDERGYLVLDDAGFLDPGTVERFARYRAERHRVAAPRTDLGL